MRNVSDFMFADASKFPDLLPKSPPEIYSEWVKKEIPRVHKCSSLALVALLNAYKGLSLFKSDSNLTSEQRKVLTKSIHFTFNALEVYMGVSIFNEELQGEDHKKYDPSQEAEIKADFLKHMNEIKTDDPELLAQISKLKGLIK